MSETINLFALVSITGTTQNLPNPPEGQVIAYFTGTGALSARTSTGEVVQYVPGGGGGGGGGGISLPAGTTEGAFLFAGPVGGMNSIAWVPGGKVPVTTGLNSWELVDLPTGGGGDPVVLLDDLADVETLGATDGQVLAYSVDTQAWHPVALDLSGGGGTGIVLPPGGVAGQMLILAQDGQTLAWADVPTGGGGSGGGPTWQQIAGTPISYPPYPGGYEKERAFDGNLGTFYSSLDANGPWLGMDFGEGQTAVVHAIRLIRRAGPYGVGQGDNLTIETSNDGVSWVPVGYTGTAEEGVLTETVLPVDTQPVRYIRVRKPADFLSIAELQVIGRMQAAD